MEKEIKSTPDKLAERPSKNHKEENPDKNPQNPDYSFEKTGPPIKGMPVKIGSNHPHDEEILDSTSF